VTLGLLCSDWSVGTVCCDWAIWTIKAEYTNHNKLGHLTNQSRVDHSQQTGPSERSEQSIPVCCDGSTLLWFVRWPSLLWLVSALIGQRTQSVVIALFCSYWSEGPVCCDLSTLLWLVRWPTLLCDNTFRKPNVITISEFLLPSSSITTSSVKVFEDQSRHCGQTMKTIGWHYANLLQWYIGM